MKTKNQKTLILTVIILTSLSLISTINTSRNQEFPSSTLLSPLEADTPLSNALNYLRSIQASNGCISDFATSCWAVMAIVAAGEDPHQWKVGEGPSIVNYLIDNRDLVDINQASEVSRFILSLTAAKETPRNVNGTDYVAALKSLFVNGQIGDESWLFDDFWGLIALVSAGEDVNSTVITETTDFIKNNQNADGGWGWAVGVDSDVDDTAAAIMALIAAGEPESSETIAKAVDFLRSSQQPDGGFPSWGIINSASDSWAIGAICSLGEDPAEWIVNGTSVLEHLLSLQNDDGSFNWTKNDYEGVNKALMTSHAIVALCKRQYPVNGLSVYLRVEGEGKTIWRGNVFVAASLIVDDEGKQHYLKEPTPLGALDKASEIKNFSYKVEDAAWGLYLYMVAGEEAAGTKGWMYRVDYVMPWTGADAFVLNVTSPPNPPHKEVLFYYGEWASLPLKISIDKTLVEVGEEITVFVSYFNDSDSQWYPTENATVYFLYNEYYTNSDGYVRITVQFDPPVWAEKEGFIRSDKIEVMVTLNPEAFTSQLRRVLQRISTLINQ